VTNSDEENREMSLYNFRLIAIITGDYESYVSLINATGEIVTLQLNENLSPGVRLVELNPERAVFEKGEDSYLVINFKNQIKETNEF
jgi:alpha-D-ribose 1-methylphosphonate 5-triphosphate diphosphatase PhnM